MRRRSRCPCGRCCAAAWPRAPTIGSPPRATRPRPAAPIAPAAAPPAALPVGTVPPSTLAAEPGQRQGAVRPWGEVSVDGRVIGTTPLDRITLPVGTHVLRVRHPLYELWE